MLVEPWRVAQIAVARAPGHAGSRGSGYLIAPGRVLTAAHVVAGAQAVRVRLDIGQDAEVDVQAEKWWADPGWHDGTDLAVITIPGDVTAGRECESALFGRISSCAAVLTVQAFGFPLFKLRADSAGPGVFRDLEQVAGHAPVAANRRSGTLAVYLDDPPPAQPSTGDPSPWEGLSGAAVWAAGRIVGVVAEHHPGEGTGRLTARRIDRAYEQLSAAELGDLAELLGLVPAASGLPDVVPAEPGQLVRSAYLAQVRDIAPDVLVGRESELAEWAEFCAGADPYAWWQAGPWAGKSALASWFVTHPPAGVDIVSFFITGRLSGQADGDAFLDAMIEQLTALGLADRGSAAVAGARAGAWLNLLESAAARTGERGRRLVVVVDGLDEDDAGATPSRGEPSIASLLPRRPAPGVRVIVTSRSDPGLPDDLPIGHPLRTCDPHRLPVSWKARNIELHAKQELRDMLAGDQIAVDVVGYIAGSGGGLTGNDLSALTRAPPYMLDPVLRGVSGRSLETRAPADHRDPPSDPTARLYLFAHETLRATAEEQFGSELARYRQQVHDWISSYGSAGWPGTTPGYAIRGYARLLAITNDVTRLGALARDRRRHAFLLQATGSDYAALNEIRNAQRLLADQGGLDLHTLVELAAYRHVISIRNQSIPPELPTAWARLGRFDHAEALARTITDPGTQARALTGLATAIAQAGDPDRAHRLAADAEAHARTITNPSDKAQALTQLVTAIAQAGDPDRAHRLAADADALARTLPYASERAWALARLATAIAQAGDPDRAEALARTITDPGTQACALAGLATAIAQAGDPDRARRLAADAEALARTNPGTQALTQLVTAIAQAGDPDRAHQLAADAEAHARAIADPYLRAWALTGLATAIAQAGDPDRAHRLAADVEALARTITYPSDKARALTGLVTVIAQAGDPDRAEALARTITDPGTQARALTGLATAIAQAGDPDRAHRLAADADALARTMTNPYDQARALAVLVTAIAQAGDLDRAEALARTITNPYDQARALAVLVTAIAQAGDPDRAEALARTITNPYDQAEVLTELATAIAQAGDPDRAEALARTITYPSDKARALAGLITAIAQAGDPDRAHRLAADAEALARTITTPGTQAQVLAGLITAIAQAGDPDRAHRLAADAEALARTITDSSDWAWALPRLITAIAQAGNLDRAEALARTITDPGTQACALAGLATAIAQAGDPNRVYRLAADAEALARTSTNPSTQDEALTVLVTAIAQAGDPDRAEALARTITSPYFQGRALARLAPLIVQAGDPDRIERFLTRVLIMDPSIWWTQTVSRFFPSVIGAVWDVLAKAYDRA